MRPFLNGYAACLSRDVHESLKAFHPEVDVANA